MNCIAAWASKTTSNERPETRKRRLRETRQVKSRLESPKDAGNCAFPPSVLLLRQSLNLREGICARGRLQVRGGPKPECPQLPQQEIKPEP
jgi:hypothetical protein